MKLLITTQKVDLKDDNLGFFHDWILEFSKHCEEVIVICLREGEHDLPENVKILSLGKECASQNQCCVVRKMNRILYIFRFFKYVWQYRKEYDSVFVHMNSEYVVMVGFLWKLWRKKIGLWFTHGSIPVSLRIAEKIVDVIFTASKASCPLGGKKVKVMGHGIDLEKYRIKNYESKIKNKIFKIVTVGRISPSKDYETLIGAVEILVGKGVKNFLVEIVGGPGTSEQEVYFEKIKKVVLDKKLDNFIKFIGPVPANEVPEKLTGADLFVHMSQTGSLDKVVLEAMASGVIVVSNNKAVKEDLFSDYKNVLCYEVKDGLMLAVRITMIMEKGNEERRRIEEDLREIVVEGHGLPGLIKRIVKEN